MTEIQKNHEIFVRESGGGTNDRDEVLKQLAAANDAYFEFLDIYIFFPSFVIDRPA